MQGHLEARAEEENLMSSSAEPPRDHARPRVALVPFVAAMLLCSVLYKRAGRPGSAAEKTVASAMERGAPHLVELAAIHRLEDRVLSLLHKSDVIRSRQETQERVLQQGSDANLSFSDITSMVNDTLMPAVMDGHNRSQGELDSLGEAFGACVSPLDAHPRHSDDIKAHKVCRGVEAGMHDTSHQCSIHLSERKAAQEVACGALHDAEQNGQVEADGCIPKPGQSYGTWVRGLRSLWKMKADRYEELLEACDSATDSVQENEPECKEAASEHEKKKQECNLKQSSVETLFCNYHDKLEHSCTNYDQCYDPKLEVYEKRRPILAAAETGFKHHWHVLQRIHCLVSIDGHSQSEIEKCMQEEHAVDRLNLTFPKIPAKHQCPRMDPVPCSEEFVSGEYGGLPEHAPAAQCTPCSGVWEIVPIEKMHYLDYSGMEVFAPGTYQQCSRAEFLRIGWDQEQYITGIDFNSKKDFLIMKDTVRRPFKGFQWYYTYGGKRGCTIDIFGANEMPGEEPPAAIWTKVGTAHWVGTGVGVKELEDIVIEDSTPFQYWKLGWVKNTNGHGPLAGWWKAMP